MLDSVSLCLAFVADTYYQCLAVIHVDPVSVAHLCCCFRKDFIINME